MPAETGPMVAMRPPQEVDDRFRIFKGEERTVALAHDLLDATPVDGAVGRDAYVDLLRAYEKLFKGARRLVRLADRNEAILNELTRNLNDRNATLEQLDTSKNPGPERRGLIQSPYDCEGGDDGSAAGVLRS